MQKIVVNPDKILADLNNAWEVLAEPIQMVMRRYAVPQAYEVLKQLTRGKSITKELLHQFIHTLNIPDEAKNALLALTPENYLGNAVDQATHI